MSALISRGGWTTLDGATPALFRPFSTAALSPNMYFGEGHSGDYEWLWQSQPNLRTVTSFVARNIAALPLHVYERTEDEGRDRVRTGPLHNLLARPNPWTSQYRMVRALVFDLMIYDRAALWLQSAAGGGWELHRLKPPEWRTAWNPDGTLDGFWLQRRGEDLAKLGASEVVWFPGFRPEGESGLSPIETLRQLLSEDVESMRLREQTWRNGARASGVIERPLDAPEWSDDALHRFREGWRSWYTGGGGDAQGTPVLEDGMTYRPIGAQTFHDAQWIEGRKLTAAAVSIAYHVAPAILGITDATFASMREYARALYVHALGPVIRQVEDDLNLQLVARIAGEDEALGREVYVEFHTEGRLRGNFDEQVATLTSAVGAPYMTRSEARSRLNLTHIDEADRLVVPLNVLEGGQANPRDTGSQNLTASVTGPIAGESLRNDPGGKAVTLDDLGTQLGRFTAELRRVAGAQADAMLGKLRNGVRTLDELWGPREEADADIAAVLLRHGFGAARAGARDTLDTFDPGFDWDDDPMLPYLQTTSLRSATAFNLTTLNGLTDALVAAETIALAEELVDKLKEVRVPQAAKTHLNLSSSFGGHDAAKAIGLRSKTWRVTSTNPRPEHSAINGETVELGATFSNGARWPGDSVLTVDQRAGCTCVLDYGREE